MQEHPGIYGKTREGVPYSAFCEGRRSLGSRRLKSSGFGLQHLWYCYKENLPWSEEFEVIRQAISCDICATEKRQTNHWFVAYEQAGELRISGWNSRHRQRPDAKHLCGQICLHKLVDEFMAKSIAVRQQRTANTNEAAHKMPAVTDASLTSNATFAKPPGAGGLESRGPWVGEPESSARLLAPPAPIPPTPTLRPQPELVTMPLRPRHEDFSPLPAERQRPASRNLRAEAWERERERELRAIENRPDIAERRRSSA